MRSHLPRNASRPAARSWRAVGRLFPSGHTLAPAMFSSDMRFPSPNAPGYKSASKL